MSNQLIHIEYDRKSSEPKERQVLSIDEQREECAKVTSRERLKVVLRLEESRSAFKPNNRPEFDKMIELIESGKANAILTWKPDRLCRNPKDGGTLLQLLQDGILKEIRCAEGEVYTPESDHLILQIHFGMANQYSRNLSRNVKRGNYYRFHNKRQWLGPAKIGWLNVTNPDTKEKEIEVDSERFPLVVKGIRLILSGAHTPMQALHKLNNELCFRTRKTKRQGGKPLSKSGWYKLLADPYLYGLMIRREGETMGNHKPMLTEDEFNRLQIILGRKGKPRIAKHQFAYKEVLKCGGCGGSITAEERRQIICPKCKAKFHKGKITEKCSGCGLLIEEMRNPKILHYVHYHCTKRVHPNCSQGSIELKKLEQQIDGELSKFEIKEEFKDWAIQYLNELNDKETQERHSSRNNAQEALKDTVKRLDNLTKLFISPQNAERELMTEEEYASQRKPLLEEKGSLTRLANEIDKRQDDWHDLTVKTFNFACYARYWFAHGDIKEKTEILGALGSNLTIKDRMLRVDALTPFLVIADGKRKAEELSQMFEPANKPDLARQSAHLEQLRQSWLRDRDLNPDTRSQNPESYR